MPKYKVFSYTNEKGLKVVKVGSTYAGKPVYGYATCAAEDEYDFAYGVKLAGARCDLKVAQKRNAAAMKKLAKVAALQKKIEAMYQDTCDYVVNSWATVKESAEKVNSIYDEKRNS